MCVVGGGTINYTVGPALGCEEKALAKGGDSANQQSAYTKSTTGVLVTWHYVY